MNLAIVITIIVSVVLIIVLVILSSSNKQYFKNIGSTGYADINDPYDKPTIIKEFITRDLCKKIIEYSNDKLIDSQVVGGKISNIRNSKQCWIPKDHSLVKQMYEKASNMFGIPIENAEDLQVVRYLPNQYYNEHHDACCDNNSKCTDFVKNGGQRYLTILVYLNNDFKDGSTYFKNLDMKFKPPPGDAIAFFPLAKGTDKCHPLALHAGMPVSSGVKWVANLWFRERFYK